jgi:4-hydroxybenzoate polyprenyltransferase
MEIAKKISGFVKLEHTLFSLPLLFAGALLAVPPHDLGKNEWLDIGLILLAGTGARTLALALNRLIDRQIDARNPRTAKRELPAGKMTPAQGWAVAAAGGILYVWAAWMLGPLCLKLSAIPVLVFVAYPLMKRFTFMAHFGVGLALALAPLGAYVAMVDAWPSGSVIWLLSLWTLLWVSGFDILYAIDDIKFDRKEGLHSIPADFSEAAARKISRTLHHVCVGMIIGMAAVLVQGVSAADQNALQKAWGSIKKAASEEPSVWSSIAVFTAGIFPAAMLMMQQKFSNSLEPGSVFFKINAWTGVAMFIFVLVGTW